MLFVVFFTIHVKYDVDIYAVARGIALMGGMMQTNALAMEEQKVLLEYSIGERSVKHNLMVVGHGRVRMQKENCISIYGGENLEIGIDHDFSSIAEKARISQYLTLDHCRCPGFRYQHQGFPILNNDSYSCYNRISMYTNKSPIPDIGFLPSKDAVFIDEKETKYVVFTNNGTGKFDVYDRQTGRSTITAYFRNYRRDGEWTEYYDFDKKQIKETGTYSENIMHGTFRTYFKGEALITSSIREYRNGRLNGICVNFRLTRHIEKIMVYNDNCLEKYILFYQNGVIQNVINMNGKRGSAIELTDEGYLKYIGGVVLRDGIFVYEGKGTLFYHCFAELSGNVQDSCMLFDGKRISFRDCYNGLRIENGKCVIDKNEDGTSLPWRLFNFEEGYGGSYLACLIGNERHIITKKFLERGKTIIKHYGIGGYLICEIILCGNKKKKINYFPLPGEGGEYRVKGITVDPSVGKYLIAHRERSKKTMLYDKTEQEVYYHNYYGEDYVLH